MIHFYRIIWIVMSPIIAAWFIWRLINGKEDRKRFAERLGFSLIKRPKGQLVWLHGSSVGETLSILPLVENLLDKDKNLHILVTSGTVTSAKIMKKKLPARAFHQYVPLDFYLVMLVFIKHWKPNLSVFVESEFWPELFHQAPNKVLINARISDRSFKRYKKHNWFIAKLLEGFKLCLAQSKQDAKRLKYLGIKNVEMSGNLKFDLLAPEINKEELNALLKQLNNRPILVCASTHNNEEKILATVHNKLKKTIPNLLTIIAPRHPHRGAIVEDITKKIGTTKRRSLNEIFYENTDFYIADTIGEMGLWYSLAKNNGVVFIGGSLIPHGGQNPLEALHMEIPVICGANMHNFKDMMDSLLADKAIQQVTSADELKDTLKNILMNKTNRNELIKPIGCSLGKFSGATCYTANKIRGLLNAGS